MGGGGGDDDGREQCLRVGRVCHKNAIFGRTMFSSQNYGP